MTNPAKALASALVRGGDEAAEALSQAFRYIHKNGQGLMNNAALNYDRLTDDEMFEVDDLFLGLQQPPNDIHGKQVTFAFTPDGEKKHNMLISLLSKASKTNVSRMPIDLKDYDVVWNSGDGQLGLVRRPQQ